MFVVNQYPLPAKGGNFPEIGQYSRVSTLLLLSGDIETNPGPARLVNFNLGFLNVRSIRNKAGANHDVIVDYRLEFLALCETWIRLANRGPLQTMLKLDGFKIANVARCRPDAGSSTAQRSLSSDSTHIGGGGQAVIYRDDLMVRQHPLRDKLPAVTSFELQLVSVGSTAPFLSVVNVYRPPSTDVGIFVDELANVLATIVSGCSDHLMLCGDVNCASATSLGLDERLSTTLMELGLTEHITQPTRDDRLLDIVASADAIPVRNMIVSDTAGISDHRLITAAFCFHYKSNHPFVATSRSSTPCGSSQLYCHPSYSHHLKLMLTTSLMSWNASSHLQWMLSVRLKHGEYASLVAIVHRCQLK